MDKEANAFAMELLMPEAFIERDVARLEDQEVESAIDELAKLYQVPRTIMVIRLTQLGYFT